MNKNEGNYRPVGFTLPTGSGYINAMGYGNEEYDWLMMPSELGGTLESPVGDYGYGANDLNGYCCAVLGSYWWGQNYSGAFCWYCSHETDFRDHGTSGRLIFVPAKH